MWTMNKAATRKGVDVPKEVPSPAEKPEPGARLLELIQMRLISEAIYVAATLGVADLLTEPRSAEELSQLTGTCSASLTRILRALVSVEVLSQGPDGRFGLTPLGEFLRRDRPDSLDTAARFYGGETGANTIQLLLECVTTGQSGPEKLAGGSWVRFLESNPERTELFHSMMTAYASLHTTGLFDAYDFAPATKIVDVGGGRGKIITEILKRNPGTQGVLFELPHVMEAARTAISAEGLADRCECLSGDFFSSVPAGGDVYLLSRVIHDWNDEKAIAILERVRAAIMPNGRLVLLEAMLRPDTKTIYPVLSDLNMLLRTGGCERTEAEYSKLYSAAGFKLTRTVVTPSPTGTTVIEGRPT